MANGWSMERDVWGNLAKELSRSYRIEYIDWTDSDGMDSFAEKIGRHVSKDEKVNILGWSMGAMASLEFACRRPDAVDKLVLISGTAKFTQDRKSGYRTGWKRSVLDKMIENLDEDRDGTVKAFRENLFSSVEIESGKAEEVMKLLDSAESHSVETLISGLEYLRDADFRERLDMIESPTLLVHGREDGIVSLEATDHIKSKAGEKCKLVEIDDCGHIPFLTHELECNGCIEAFLNGGR